MEVYNIIFWTKLYMASCFNMIFCFYFGIYFLCFCEYIFKDQQSNRYMFSHIPMVNVIRKVFLCGNIFNWFYNRVKKKENYKEKPCYFLKIYHNFTIYNFMFRISCILVLPICRVINFLCSPHFLYKYQYLKFLFESIWYTLIHYIQYNKVILYSTHILFRFFISNVCTLFHFMVKVCEII